MSELALSVPQQTRQAIEAKDRSAPRKVTGRLRTAVDAMVWQGARRAEAASIGNMTDHSLRSALNKPHVKAYYLGQLEVLRTSERARNIHRLVNIRDAADNMPAVNAIKMLEQLGEDTVTRSAGSVALPGLTIQIITQAAEVHAHNARAPNPAQVIDNAESDPP